MHSPFPWSTHPQVTSAVFDADGKRIVDAWHPIDPDTAADNAALIARATSLHHELVAALEDVRCYLDTGNPSVPDSRMVDKIDVVLKKAKQGDKP